MRYLIVVNILLLVGLYLIVGFIFHNTREVSAPSSSESPPDVYLSMLLAGLDTNEKEEAKKNALIWNALYGQSIHPELAEEIWNHLEVYYANKPGFEQVVGFTIYWDSINDAVKSCANYEMFEMLWAIRDEVQNKRRDAMKKWKDELQSKLALKQANISS